MCGKKEQKSLRTHRTWPRAIRISAGPERLQGPGLEVKLCLGSVLLPNVDSNRYCRQGPKRQFASRKFKFKLAARPPAAPARPAGRRGRRCQSSDFECRGPVPGVAQFTEPESGRRLRRGCPAAPAARSGVSDTSRARGRGRGAAVVGTVTVGFDTQDQGPPA